MAVVEFALVLPMLMTMFYGCIEITRYILVVQKVQLAHGIRRDGPVARGDHRQPQPAAGCDQRHHEPVRHRREQRVIIAPLYRPPGTTSTASVNWRHFGGGTLTATSQLGDVGTTPTMPGRLPSTSVGNVIAAEVYFQFSPLVSNRFFGTTTVYRSAFYKPRLGALTAPPRHRRGPCCNGSWMIHAVRCS